MSEMTVAAGGAISVPASARDEIVDRFLARVAALTPAQWGELDAIAQRETAGDPLARWRMARRMAAEPALESEWARAGVTAFLFGVDLVQSAVALVRGEGRWPVPTRRATPAWRSEEMRAFDRCVQTLWDTAAAQPGGQREAVRVLTIALAAIWARPYLAPDAFARRWELVEPVIPIRSLVR